MYSVPPGDRALIDQGRSPGLTSLTCLEVCVLHPLHFSVGHVSVEWSLQCQGRGDGGDGGWLWWRRA